MAVPGNKRGRPPRDIASTLPGVGLARGFGQTESLHVQAVWELAQTRDCSH